MRVGNKTFVHSKQSDIDLLQAAISECSTLDFNELRAAVPSFAELDDGALCQIIQDAGLTVEGTDTVKELAQIIVYADDEKQFKVKLGFNGTVTDSGEQETILKALEAAVDDHPDSQELYGFFGWE